MSDYSVRQGDTFTTLGVTYYGGSEFGEKISEANEKELRYKLVVGENIHLPDYLHRIEKVENTENGSTIHIKRYYLKKLVNREIVLTDDEKHPVPGANFQVIINNRVVQTAQLDGFGKAEIEVPEDVNYTIRFLGIE